MVLAGADGQVHLGIERLATHVVLAGRALEAELDVGAIRRLATPAVSTCGGLGDIETTLTVIHFHLQARRVAVDNRQPARLIAGGTERGIAGAAIAFSGFDRMALAIGFALQAQQAVIAALGPEAVALAIAVLGTRRRTLGAHGEGAFADHHRGRILAIEGRAHAQITTLVRGLAATFGAGARLRRGRRGIIAARSGRLGRLARGQHQPEGGCQQTGNYTHGSTPCRHYREARPYHLSVSGA